MIIKSKSNTVYWVPIPSTLAGVVVSLGIVMVLITGDPDKIFQIKVLPALLAVLAFAIWMPLSELRKISCNGEELIANGVFKKRRYVIGEAVIAVTSMGRQKAVGLVRPLILAPEVMEKLPKFVREQGDMELKQEVIEGMATLTGAVKVAKKLGEYFDIPYGETKSFQQVQEFLNK